MKGIEFSDVRKQMNWLSKEYKSSPTVSTKGLIISYIIDAMEVRYVAISDITGVFLQTYYKKGEIHINTGGGVDSTLGDRPILLQLIHLYRYPQKN